MKKTWNRIIAGAFLSCLLVGAAACSDDDDDTKKFLTGIDGYIVQSFDGETPQFNPYLRVVAYYTFSLAEVDMEDTDGTPVVWDSKLSNVYEALLPARAELDKATGLYAFIAKSTTGEMSGAGVTLSAGADDVMPKLTWDDFNFTYDDQQKTVSYVVTGPSSGMGTLRYGVRFIRPRQVDGVRTYLRSDAEDTRFTSVPIEGQPGKVRITAQLPDNFAEYGEWRYIFYANRGVIFQEKIGQIQMPQPPRNK